MSKNSKAKVFATMAGCGIICGVMVWIAVGGLGMPIGEEFLQYLVGGIMVWHRKGYPVRLEEERMAGTFY